MKKVYLIAVVVAIIAGFATYMFASEIDKKTTIKDADTVVVYVPLQDIPKNTKITEDMFAEDSVYFTQKTVVAADATPNYVTDKADLINKITVDTLYANEQVNSARLQDADGEDVALSYKLADGKVAYALNAASTNGVDGFITEGDTVDIIVSRKDEKSNETKSEIAYKGLKIIRVSDNATNTSASKSGAAITSYNTITVEVTKEQALELSDIEQNYSFKLILNQREKFEGTQADVQQSDAQ